MDLWNVKNLPIPTIDTYKAQDRSIDLTALNSTISKAIYVLTKPTINREAAMLSRSIYRMKRKFRMDKGFKNMEKMNRALLQMLRIGFTDTLKSYLDTIPTKYERNTYLPTLNMIHYILVRLQGISKLLVRLCEVSKCSALFMQERIHIAQMWKVAFIVFGMISRIYVLAKEMLDFCCEFYVQLVPYCRLFKNVGVAWLPAGYVLPDNLKNWLNVELDDNVVTLVDNLNLQNVSMLAIDSDVDVRQGPENILIGKEEDVGELVERVNDRKSVGELVEPIRTKKKLIKNVSICKEKKLKKAPKNISCNVSECKEEDTGGLLEPPTKKLKKVPTNTSISKEHNELVQFGDKKKLKKKKGHLNLQVNSLDDLKSLAKQFNRLKSDNYTPFKNVDKLQCNMIHNLIKKSLKKANKCRTNSSIVDKCIQEVQDVLKLYF